MYTRHALSTLIALCLIGSALPSQGAKPKLNVSAEKASKIALKRYPGKLAKKPVLEHEDGAWQYEVLIRFHGKLKEVNVNAVTGRIGSVENTSPKEEANESKEKKGH